MRNGTIGEALWRAKGAGGRDWGVTLRSYLDEAGVPDVERVKAVRELVEDARELLACVSLDGTEATNAEDVACVLDKVFDAADSLAVALEELTKRCAPGPHAA